MSDASVDFKKGLLKKDKLELVKILKSKNQPTNGGKADLVDRILAYDEKNGGKMARKASKAGDEPPPDYDEEDELKEGEGHSSGAPKKKKKSKPKKNKNNDDDERGGGGGGPSCGACSGDNVDCDGGIVGVAQVSTALSAIGQLVLGILQFVLLAETMNDEDAAAAAGYTLCNEDLQDTVTDYACVGPSLFWETPGTDGHDDFNASWRLIFTLRPSYFFTNWVPQLFGVIAIMQMFYSTSWDFVSGSWIKCMFFHIVMFLFAAFGYCGKAGIIIGFIEVFAAFMCLVMIFMKNAGNTYPMWNY